MSQHSLRAVSAYHLDVDLCAAVRAAGLELSVSVHDIEPLIRAKGKDVICPQTHKLGASYVDSLEGEDNVGQANFMLSYSWRYLVRDIVRCLGHHVNVRDLQMKRTYYWICCLCINQHRVKEAVAAGVTVPFEEFREAFQARVEGIGHVLALMAPWDDPVYVTRVWCVFELFTSVSNPSCQLTVVLPPAEMQRFCTCITQGNVDENLWASLEQLDVQSAEASVAADKVHILQLVESGIGAEKLNQVVRNRLLLWLGESAQFEASSQISQGDLYGDPAAIACAKIAALLHRLGRHHLAADLLAEGRTVVPAEDTEEKANFWRVLGQNLEYLGRPREASEAYLEASAMLGRLGSLESHDGAAMLTCAAAQLETAGRREDALAQYREAWRIRRACGADRCLDASDLLTMMGQAECRLGMPEGLEHAERGVELKRDLARLNTPYGAFSLQQLGSCYLACGMLPEAQAQFESSREVLGKLGMMQTAQGAILLKNHAQCYYKIGDSETELKLLQESRQVLEDCGQLRSSEGAAVLLDLGSALLDARQDQQAKEVLQLALDICEERQVVERITELVRQRLAKAGKSSSFCTLS